MDSLKVQTTLRGYSAWVVQRMMAEKGESLADVSKYLIDRLLDDNQKVMADFGLSRSDFRKSEEEQRNLEEAREKVVQLPNRNDSA